VENLDDWVQRKDIGPWFNGVLDMKYGSITLIAIFCLATVSTSLDGRAQQATPNETFQILYFDVDPIVGAPGRFPNNFQIFRIDNLPTEDSARREMMAAVMRANPVTSFSSDSKTSQTQFENLYLVSDFELTGQDGEFEVKISQGTVNLPEMFSRLATLVDQFDPKNRQIAHIKIIDLGGQFPNAVDQFHDAVAKLGFEMAVIDIYGSAPSCSDKLQLQTLYGTLTGLADRAPFGNADGNSTTIEVENFIRAAVNRRVSRGSKCGLSYSLVLKANTEEEGVLVATHKQAVFVEMETVLFNEQYEAKFLLSKPDKASLRRFLETCQFCPNEQKLLLKQHGAEEYDLAQELEGQIWSRIKEDQYVERLAVYLEDCTLCEYREEAAGKISLIGQKVAARKTETLAFERAADKNDLEELKQYSQTCITCDHLEKAGSLISQIEADTRYANEKAVLMSAVENRDMEALSTFVSSCDICSGKEVAVEIIADINRRESLAGPCVKAAGLPQQGGPRLREKIDQVPALAICKTAFENYPEDGELFALMGRINQAAGDFDSALKFYEVAVEKQATIGFGLAAHAHYEPPEGKNPDLKSAVALATQGAERGDWLSREILSIVYAKNLVEGKSPQDAFEIALELAEEENPLAEYLVGYYYVTGTGVDENPSSALKWFERAAAQNYVHSFSFLAEMLEAGEVVEVDLTRAAELYWIAIESGDQIALQRMTDQIGERDRGVIKYMQEKLSSAGLYSGSVDGIGGRSTIAALQKLVPTTEAENL
jgi:hypothetical protein